MTVILCIFCCEFGRNRKLGTWVRNRVRRSCRIGNFEPPTIFPSPFLTKPPMSAPTHSVQPSSVSQGITAGHNALPTRCAPKDTINGVGSFNVRVQTCMISTLSLITRRRSWIGQVRFSTNVEGDFDKVLG